MGKYAEGTTVPVEKSKLEIDQTLQRYGATQRGIIVDDAGHRAVIIFHLHERDLRLNVRLPPPDERRFTRDSRGVQRSRTAAAAAYAAEVRRIWRVQLITLKTKLEAVAEDPDAFRDEFLAVTLLPNGQTVGEWAAEDLNNAYSQGLMPPLLPGMPRRPELPAARQGVENA
jgi:hypothetical protein